MREESRRGESLWEKGTVYWLLISGILTGLLSLGTVWYTGRLYVLAVFTLSILQLGLAYVCWKMRRWGFLISLASAVAYAGLSFEILYSPVGVLLFVIQLQIVFFAYNSVV